MPRDLTATSPVNYTRLFLLFLLFLVALYYLLGVDESYQTINQYDEEKYRVQRSCFTNDDCLNGFVCDLETSFCVEDVS